jgi:hypothetical protein
VILERHGVAVELPAGWSGRLSRRPAGGATLHAATFALSLEDGQFGDRSTAVMPPGSTFLSLTEYRADGHLKAGAGLFRARRLPVPVDPLAFSRRTLAHPRPGHSGVQHFFTAAGRPFCLYVVIASGPGQRGGRRAQLAALNRVLGSIRIAARS